MTKLCLGVGDAFVDFTSINNLAAYHYLFLQWTWPRGGGGKYFVKIYKNLQNLWKLFKIDYKGQ